MGSARGSRVEASKEDGGEEAAAAEAEAAGVEVEEEEEEARSELGSARSALEEDAWPDTFGRGRLASSSAIISSASANRLAIGSGLETLSLSCGQFNRAGSLFVHANSLLSMKQYTKVLEHMEF